MRKKHTKIPKKYLFIFLAILITAIFVPLTAYALSVNYHVPPDYNQNDTNCSVCGALPDGIKDDNPANDKTIGVVSFDYTNAYACEVSVPDGYEITYIIVKAGTGHKLYTLDPGTTSYQVDTDGLLNNGGQTPAISHVRVIYTGQPADPKISVTGTKIWSADPGVTYPSITLYLYNDVDADPVDSHVLDADDYSGDVWTYTFTDLPANDGEGHTYVYRVDESSVPGYDKSISRNGLTITNTQQERQTIDIPVTKVWRGKTPYSNVTVDVFLVQDGRVTDYYVTLSAENDWTGLFEGLDPDHTYSVEEDANDIPARYSSSVSGDVESGFTVTNRYHEPPDEDEEEDEEEEEEEEIPEPDVPLDEIPEEAPPLDDSPQTGDQMNYVWLLLLATVAVTAFGAVRYMLKSQN